MTLFAEKEREGKRCYKHLSHLDRLTNDEGIRTGLSMRAIGRGLKCALPTVSREQKWMGPYSEQLVPEHALFPSLTVPLEHKPHVNTCSLSRLL
jgi:Helix-turn-helix domain